MNANDWTFWKLTNLLMRKPFTKFGKPFFDKVLMIILRQKVCLYEWMWTQWPMTKLAHNYAIFNHKWYWSIQRWFSWATKYSQDDFHIFVSRLIWSLFQIKMSSKAADDITLQYSADLGHKNRLTPLETLRSGKCQFVSKVSDFP